MMAIHLLTIMCAFTGFQISSLNVNGLRNNAKMGSILSQLRPDLCVQETRWDVNSVKHWKQQWDGEIYSNEGSCTSCGVAVLFK